MTSAPLPLPSSVDQPTGDQPASPGMPARPQLRRSGTDTMVGGVCGGLAEHTGIDPLVWRVGFVGLTVAGGAGILAYLLLWVLLPAGPRRAGHLPGPLDRVVERLHTAVTGRGATSRRN
jgi:phage shock protein C